MQARQLQKLSLNRLYLAHDHLNSFINHVHGRFRGQTPDMAVYNDMIKQLDAKLDAYNVILGQQKYLAGNVRTIFYDFEAIVKLRNRTFRLLTSSISVMVLSLAERVI
jgi:hypothetical protein